MHWYTGQVKKKKQAKPSQKSPRSSLSAGGGGPRETQAFSSLGSGRGKAQAERERAASPRAALPERLWGPQTGAQLGFLSPLV